MRAMRFSSPPQHGSYSRSLKRLVWIAVSIGLSHVLFGCQTASAFRSDCAQPTFVRVNGSCQFLLVRGPGPRAPALLWLHGGPGGSETPFFRLYNAPLERDFQVAYWDQRGAGRSYDPSAPTSLLTVTQMLADLDKVVEIIRTKTGRRKVVLLGHSWGSALGLLYTAKHPDKVGMFVGVGQVTATKAADAARREYVETAAKTSGDDEALQEIASLGPAPFGRKDGIVMDRLVDRFGGAFHHRPNLLRLALKTMLAGKATIADVPRSIQANRATLDAMWPELRTLNLPRDVPSSRVPVVFMLGRFDHQAPSALAAAYFRRLNAPIKHLRWFDDSAHNIPVEEPQRFNAAIVESYRALVGCVKPMNSPD